MKQNFSRKCKNIQYTELNSCNMVSYPKVDTVPVYKSYSLDVREHDCFLQTPVKITSSFFCFSVKMTILTQIVTHIANTIYVHVITTLFCISFIPTRVVLVAVFLKHSTRDHVETTTFNVITRQQSTYLNTANADQFLEDPVTGPSSSANKQVHLRINFFCL